MLTASASASKIRMLRHSMYCSSTYRVSVEHRLACVRYGVRDGNEGSP